VPVQVTGVTNATAVAVSQDGSCALLTDGTVKCWGLVYPNSNGSWRMDATPLTVPGVSGAIAIGSGEFHFCAVLGDGSVTCWGMNDNGELGDGTTVRRTASVAVVGLAGPVKAIPQPNNSPVRQSSPAGPTSPWR
jgi:alpha-tubulin suppressor-like RCC1 family protein